MNERVNSAVTALLSDGSLLSSFRRDPAGATRQFRLSECELDALKSGDEQSLMAHGMAHELITGKLQTPHWFGGLVGTVARRMAAPALVAILLALAVQGGGTSEVNAATGKGRAGARLRRATGRSSARSNVRMARAGVQNRRSYSVGIRMATSHVICSKC